MKSSKRSSKQRATNWLDRFLVVGPHLALCTSQEEFETALHHLKVDPVTAGSWIVGGGTTHTFEKDDGGMTCIVCVKLKDIKKRPICEVANILVHEAVHVWQQHCSEIGERNPSVEFEAYSIQAIFTVLFTEALKRRAS